MRTALLRWLPLPLLAALLAVGWMRLPEVESACCYFAAKDKDILQPAQKVFLTWEPTEKIETFTVQPRFEGNASDFGMVIPTPAKPKRDEMPRDFFKSLAIFTILKKRERPHSKLLPHVLDDLKSTRAGMSGRLEKLKDGEKAPRASTVKVLEKGIVGN